MIADTVVFRSVDHALRVAFRQELERGAVKGTMEFLEDMAEQRYGRSLRSTSDTGLSREEMRAQCVLVRAAVDDHLQKAVERYAIYARFGHLTRRIEGLNGLCDHWYSICSTANRMAIFALLDAAYSPKKRGGPKAQRRFSGAGALERQHMEELSLRAIERKYSASRSSLHRDQKVLKKVCGDVEMLAQMHLEELFVRTGLIPNPNDA